MATTRVWPIATGTHGAPVGVVSLDMTDLQTNEEGGRNHNAETQLRLPMPSQFKDAEAFATEQAQLRNQNLEGNDGRKTLMISHW